MKKTLIIGWGRSGKAAGAFLKKLGREYLVFDDNSEVSDLPALGTIYLSEISQIILSPGFDPRCTFIDEAKKRGIEVIGEMELGLRYVKNPCIGITGTNGKTTTTLLCAHFLNQSGIKAVSLGNIGTPLTEYLLDPADEVLVLEFSSYQIETLKSRSLDAVAILNISPNHLDRYDSFEHYRDTKLELKKFLKEDGLYIEGKDCTEFVEGVHPENYGIAKRLASYMGAKSFSLDGFERPEHRLSFVCKKEGVSFYNDSKSTNVESVIFAVESIDDPIILICGGVHKGFPYAPWKKAFQKRVKRVYAIGNSAKKIAKELESDFDIIFADSLEDAVKKAYLSAEKNDTILLSPGCSSFDHFKNYEHRGEEFIRIANNLGSLKL